MQSILEIWLDCLFLQHPIKKIIWKKNLFEVVSEIILPNSTEMHCTFRNSYWMHYLWSIFTALWSKRNKIIICRREYFSYLCMLNELKFSYVFFLFLHFLIIYIFVYFFFKAWSAIVYLTFSYIWICVFLIFDHSSIPFIKFENLHPDIWIIFYALNVGGWKSL